MLKFIATLLIAAGFAAAQTSAAAPATGGTFYGVFAQMNAQTPTHPQPTGGWVVATEISASQGIWSFNETDFTLVGGKIQTSPRTGGSLHMRDFGVCQLYALVDGGLATTGSATGSAFAGGGFVACPTKFDLLWFEAGYRVLHTSIGGTSQYIEIGLLRRAK